MREKKEINLQIGEQVRYAREQAHLTQEQLAERIDVSPQYVSDLERGVVGISLSTLKHLCMELHVSSDQILFAKRAENDVSELAKKCSYLGREHFEILSVIVNKYLEAIRLTEEPISRE